MPICVVHTRRVVNQSKTGPEDVQNAQRNVFRAQDERRRTSDWVMTCISLFQWTTAEHAAKWRSLATKKTMTKNDEKWQNWQNWQEWLFFLCRYIPTNKCSSCNDNVMTICAVDVIQVENSAKAPEDVIHGVLFPSASVWILIFEIIIIHILWVQCISWQTDRQT